MPACPGDHREGGYVVPGTGYLSIQLLQSHKQIEPPWASMGDKMANTGQTCS
jgi:hypothetical protein